MDFKHITYDFCPDCGAPASSFRLRSKHSNGHWNEYKEFSCGREDHFSPNFMVITIEDKCRNHPKFKEQEKKDKTFLSKIRGTVERSTSISEDMKKRITDALKYL